jgi:pimeloyl-ACP methyl ester carboxylesterase
MCWCSRGSELTYRPAPFLPLVWATGTLLVILGLVPAGIHAQDAGTTPQVCPAPQGKTSPTTAPADYPQPVRIAANPAKGFYSPYFLFIPVRISHDTKSRLRLIVNPNNSGFTSDDPEAFEKDALKTICNRWRSRATTLGVAALVPAFPRPKGSAGAADVYTHALSRAAMTTPVPTLHCPDLQLIAMIDDAAAREAKAGLRFNRRVLMFGFSASAMFTNRFVFLHPDRVLAAAYGSPGGWALAPVASWQGALLPYPVGIGDIKALTGKSFDLRAVAKVPQLFLLGTADTNDSVVYSDSFDKQARKLIFDKFGATLMARWPYTERLYAEYLPNATLKLYPGIGHTYSPEMDADVMAFFSRFVKAD